MSGGIFVSTTNMLHFANIPKEKFYLNNTINNEIQKYNTYPLKSMKDTEYTITVNNVDIDMYIMVQSKKDNKVILEFTGICGENKKVMYVSYVK